MTQAHDIIQVRDYFMELQDTLCDCLEMLDGKQKFLKRERSGPAGGLTRPRVLESTGNIEKAAVQFSHSIGTSLPPAATARNPQLAGHRFQATAISLIVHPLNPYVPTCHMNLRFFLVEAGTPVWYFGGGFDLTPYYGFAEDAVHWHTTARDACQSFGEDVYPELKSACDDYFYLSHRREARGIGGIFFDDWTRGGFTTSFSFVRSVGNHFLAAYEPIFRRRISLEWGERERDFQLYRRGRYAEFNLAIDRGTRYGLQSGRRVESVLASLPPLVKWRYDYQPPVGSAEALLGKTFLTPKDWLHQSG